MARARRSTTTGTAAANGSGTALVCPECGREFTRAASLGAHRNRAHGVAGSAKPTRAARRRSAAPKATAAGTTRTPRTASRGGNGIDRDTLLAAVFPQGVPPRESVIREVAAWLDQAERLAKLR